MRRRPPPTPPPWGPENGKGRPQRAQTPPRARGEWPPPIRRLTVSGSTPLWGAPAVVRATPGALVATAYRNLSKPLVAPRRSERFRLLLSRRLGDNPSCRVPLSPALAGRFAGQISLYGAGSDETPVELLVWATGFSGNGHREHPVRTPVDDREPFPSAAGPDAERPRTNRRPRRNPQRRWCSAAKRVASAREWIPSLR